MTIRLLEPISVAGAHQAINAQLSLEAALEADLVNQGKAVYVSRDLAPGEGLTNVQADASGTALVVGGDEVPIGELSALDGISRRRTGLENRAGGTHNNTSIKKYIYRRFLSLAGLTITGGATAEIVTLNGIRCLKVTTVAGTNAEVQLDGADLAGPLHDVFVWRIKMEDSSKVDALTCLLSKNNYAGWWNTGFTIAGGANIFETNDWHELPQHRTYGSDSGTGLNWDTETVDKAKLRIAPEPGQVAVVYLHSLSLVVKESKPKIILGFDDNRRACIRAGYGASATVRGTAGTYTHREILDAYGYKGTLWLVTGYLSGDRQTTDTMTWAEIAELHAAGWDVQAQTHYNPGQSGGVIGSRLLGPYGYATRSISAVTPATDTFTSAAHAIFQGVYAYPLEFVGTDLPSGVNTGVIYYARGTDNDNFKIYHTEADSIAGTGAIDLVDTGTPANFGWRYGGSENDDSAIYADFARLNTEIKANLGITPWLIAYNQGGVDEFVRTAAKRAGYLFGRTVYQIAYHGLATVDRQDVADFGPHPQSYVIQIDEATARDVAYYTGLISAAVTLGVNIHTFAHATSATTAQNLANFCEAAYLAEVAGTVEVCTAAEAYAEFV